MLNKVKTSLKKIVEKGIKRFFINQNFIFIPFKVIKFDEGNLYLSIHEWMSVYKIRLTLFLMTHGYCEL